MKFKIIMLTVLIPMLVSFAPGKSVIEFSYPDNKDAVILMTTDRFKLMKKEAQGTDYYYSGEDNDGMICSVLFYKLNDDEVANLVDLPSQLTGGPIPSPAYPQTYFSTYSNTKELESNEERWGDPAKDFMFRHTDIKEFQGQKVNQKNMFAFAMFGKNLFVSIHLSKGNCSPADSTEMRQILETLKKKK